ncbi:O-antigen ligase family protein [Dialister hominis]|uniref:O-antigen ligase family protein n=1 Tax=Dialister hominis TaxID=2582419 RepID=UPI003AB4E6B0
MQGKYKKIEEWLLFFMILFIPLKSLPARYKLPLLGKNVAVALLVTMCVVCLIWWLRNKKEFHIPHAKFVGLFCFWVILCTSIGAFTYPFYPGAIDAALADKSAVKTIAHVWPGIVNTTSAIHLVHLFGNIGGLIKGLLLPFVGMYVVLFSLYGRNSRRGVEWVSKAVVTMACLMGLYSIFEIYWLWTGNLFCQNLLMTINRHLYDPGIMSGWWPPILWEGQLRSYLTEPSFFGIIGSFMVPFLWYRIFQENRKIEYLLLLYFVLMIFMTKSRTAIVIYLGEVFCLLLFSIILRYKQWWKACLAVVLGTILSFGIYIEGSVAVPQYFGNKEAVAAGQAQKPGGPVSAKVETAQAKPVPASPQANNKTPPQQAPAAAPVKPPVQSEAAASAPAKLQAQPEPVAKNSKNKTDINVWTRIQNYLDSNVFSVADKDKRSNEARFGTTIAMATVGIQHPVFGVGQGYVDRYMVNTYPDFAKDNGEVKRWISDVTHLEFGDASFPVVNAFSNVLAEYGIPGLIIFCAPLFYLFGQLILKRKEFSDSFEAVCLAVALAGQVACLFSQWFFYTYPLVLCLTYCFVADRCSKAREDTQNTIK